MGADYGAGYPLSRVPGGVAAEDHHASEIRIRDLNVIAHHERVIRGNDVVVAEGVTILPRREACIRAVGDNRVVVAERSGIITG